MSYLFDDRLSFWKYQVRYRTRDEFRIILYAAPKISSTIFWPLRHGSASASTVL